ncbi:MAG: zinc dependent phospholipase C family protein [Chloroflexia bacterium]|nr:zinc dependent phospholipase C family protein [Chloroflexia bacterium]
MKARLAIDHEDEFNLGAVIPDMRYFDGTPWNQTHVPIEEFWTIAQQEMVRYADPCDRDFALGYLLHLAMDKSWHWLVEQVRGEHPLGRVLPPRVLKLSIEVAMVDLHPLKDIAFSRRVPPLAERFGIRPESLLPIRKFADDGLSDPNIIKTYRFMIQTGVVSNPAIKGLMLLGAVVLFTPLRIPLVAPIRRTLRRVDRELERRILAELRPFISLPPSFAESLEDVATLQPAAVPDAAILAH